MKEFQWYLPTYRKHYHWRGKERLDRGPTEGMGLRSVFCLRFAVSAVSAVSAVFGFSNAFNIFCLDPSISTQLSTTPVSQDGARPDHAETSLELMCMASFGCLFRWCLYFYSRFRPTSLWSVDPDPFQVISVPEVEEAKRSADLWKVISSFRPGRHCNIRIQLSAASPKISKECLWLKSSATSMGQEFHENSKLTRLRKRHALQRVQRVCVTPSTILCQVLLNDTDRFLVMASDGVFEVSPFLPFEVWLCNLLTAFDSHW